MSLRPLRDRVLVAPDAPPEQTQSGLHLVEHWPQETSGVVQAVGAEARERIAVGDRVLFPPSAGQDVHLNDVRFILMREADVLAVIESAHV